MADCDVPFIDGLWHFMASKIACDPEDFDGFDLCGLSMGTRGLDRLLSGKAWTLPNWKGIVVYGIAVALATLALGSTLSVGKTKG